MELFAFGITKIGPNFCKKGPILWLYLIDVRFNRIYLIYLKS